MMLHQTGIVEDRTEKMFDDVKNETRQCHNDGNKTDEEDD